MSHKLINHHKKPDGKLAGLLHDVQGQTSKLHDAVESATSPPPAFDPVADLLVQTDNLASIRTVLEDTVIAIDTTIAAIKSDIAAIQAIPPVSVPSPQPTPVPAPSPLPNPGPPSTITWPSFTGTDALIGTSKSGMVTVFVDASLGAQATQNATDLLADADRVFSENSSIFAVKSPLPVNVLLFAIGGATDGTGGADHAACTYKDGGNIEVCVSYGQSMRCSGLFEAELSECAMNGQLCGLSTGEALSRWCAAVVSSDTLADFDTAPQWQSDGLANWVDQVEPTDQDPDSIGCGMAFISYLLHRGATLPQIAQAMVKLGDAGTLADLYVTLKMGTAAVAWVTFEAAIASLGTITSDDPFGQVTMAMSAHKHI